MKLIRIGFLIFLSLTLLACGDSDLLEEYFVKAPRILAVKVEDPEVSPQETVTMRMLVGGQEIDQEMTNTVYWGIDDFELESIETSQYSDPVGFQYQIPADALGGEQWYDMPILARIEINGKGLNAYKALRITQTPTAKNPVISGVRIRYLTQGVLNEQTAADGDVITVPADAANVALTAQMETLPPGANDKLVYRWYISLAKGTDGKLYIQEEDKRIEELLGQGADASEGKASAVFSLKGEDSDKEIQTGIYDVYLVVRDNAESSQSLADERHGTDFIYFTLCINSNCL